MIITYWPFCNNSTLISQLFTIWFRMIVTVFMLSLRMDGKMKWGKKLWHLEGSIIFSNKNAYQGTEIWTEIRFSPDIEEAESRFCCFNWGIQRSHLVRVTAVDRLNYRRHRSAILAKWFLHLYRSVRIWSNFSLYVIVWIISSIG